MLYMGPSTRYPGPHFCCPRSRLLQVTIIIRVCLNYTEKNNYNLIQLLSTVLSIVFWAMCIVLLLMLLKNKMNWIEYSKKDGRRKNRIPIQSSTLRIRMYRWVQPRIPMSKHHPRNPRLAEIPPIIILKLPDSISPSDLYSYMLANTTAMAQVKIQIKEQGRYDAKLISR